eukprot:c9762_g1_i1.p1 GENE.c9762_g1_i1~~c9762_g1_i1.p1  ORF type:complete len:894 (-),score=194.25 c9762_g1_i1:20-2701(-)
MGGLLGITRSFVKMADASAYVAIDTPPTPEATQSRRKVWIRVAGLVTVLAAVAVVLVLLLVDNNVVHDNVKLRAASPNGIYVFMNNSIIELAVFGTSAFRVSVSFSGALPTQIDTPMVDTPTSFAPFTVVTGGDWQGISTSYGLVALNNVTGQFYMKDASGRIITQSDVFVTYSGSNARQSRLRSTCNSAHANYDVNNPQRTPSCPNGLSGQTQATCCQACDNDKDCTVWVYATPGHESDGKNCWLLQGQSVSVHSATNRIVGGAVTGIPQSITINLGKSSTAKFYGPGCGSDDANKLAKTASNPLVSNTIFYTPHYYSTDGYAALGVSALDFDPNQILAYPANWDANSANQVVWSIQGDHADMYLTPAKDQATGLSNYWDITGRPAIPPRYAFGFLACRWGWTDVNYIANMLSQFRSGNFPIDAWISDFEWYTPQPDYTVPDQGLDSFVDFGYNAVTFPDPVNNLKTYHDTYHMRFGGIRKPRLGNKQTLVDVTAKGWTVNADHSGGAPGGPRNLNYSIPELRTWYSDNHAHFLEEGVDFWWNDEGETFYFAFHWWNMAQLEGLSKFDAKKRFFTINRSYTPGMQRIAATQWTGDIIKSWQSMQQQPGYVINWGLAGTPYVTCDTGGFRDGDETPLLLSRWYQVAAFMPIMRVHSNLDDTPHFPFLFGDEAAVSMRNTLNLRYQFIPYHYSLAHSAYRPNGRPIFRPMLMEFPNDASVAEMTSQWMDGDSVLVCPVMNENNSTSCYLPAGNWFEFASTTTHNGGQTLNLQQVSLNTIPLYVKAGSIVPLAPVVQYSDLLPGGNLQVQVYTGADATFVLVEDDGETLGYQNAVSRDVVFAWFDSKRTLYWQVNGSFQDSHSFTSFQVLLYSPGKSTSSAVLDLSRSGSVYFDV